MTSDAQPAQLGNGLTTTSVHAYDASSASALSELLAERQASVQSGRDVAGDDGAVDPQTVARRYLQHALASPSLPSLVATPDQDGTPSEFTTINTETVGLTGTRVVKFRQTLHGIPVYGSLVMVELDEDNELVSLESSLGEPTDVDPVASIAPTTALRAADTADDGYRPNLSGRVPALQFYFDTPQNRWRLVYIIENVSVALDPTGEPNAAAPPSDFEPPRLVDYVIDAHSGDVVTLLPRTPSISGIAQSAIDAFGTLRDFFAAQKQDGFELFDPTHNVRTFDFSFGDPTTDESRLPGSAVVSPPTWSGGAVSAHSNAVAVSDYLRTVLRRDNIDDRGSVMISTINCVVPDPRLGPNEWHNAFWNGQQMVYGQALHGHELRTLAANIDVVAHEMFHGITDHTSRLEYAFQPGALNESYSDIFGTIIANLGNEDPRTWDWKLGERLLGDDKPFRDLSDPASCGQPAHMNNFQVLPNTRRGDWGGVHVNSGIHNKAAYLALTAEKDGTLILTPTEVAGVFYLALTQRLSRTSQFADSRRAVVASARTLLRHLPLTAQETKIAALEDAFDAVGIS